MTAVVAMAMPATATAAADVKSRFADSGARSVVKDSTYATSVVVTNHGDASAVNAKVSVGAWGSANLFSPTHAPNPAFTPELAFTGGCASAAGSLCVLGNLAPGESRVVSVQVTKLTHYGTLSLSSSAYHDGGYNDSGYRSWQVQVTNGKSSLLQVSAEAPSTAAGRSDVVVTGEISNGGPDVIDAGRFVVETTRLDALGDYLGWNSGSAEVGSIKSLKLSNGTVCPAFVDPVTQKASLNKAICQVDAMAPNSRLTFELIVNYPTSKRDFWVGIDGTFTSTNFLSNGSRAGFSKDIQLSPEKSVDLETTVGSQGLIGLDRVAAVTVTVKNNGATKAENVSLAGDARGGVGGTFDKDMFPSTCTGVLKPIFARCAMGDIEAGQAKTFTISVRAANKLGLLAVSFGASHDNAGFVADTNPDNNSATATLQVVKANAVPFKGVKETNPPKQNLGQFLRSGARTTITCPSGCKATVALQVKRTVAERLGLVRKVRGTRRAKALPYIVIGKGVKARTSAGKVVVVAKVTRAYKVKLAKLRVPLTLSRVSTVVATDKSIRGASYTRSKAMVVRPARKARR